LKRKKEKNLKSKEIQRKKDQNYIGKYKELKNNILRILLTIAGYKQELYNILIKFQHIL